MKIKNERLLKAHGATPISGKELSFNDFSQLIQQNKQVSIQYNEVTESNFSYGQPLIQAILHHHEALRKKARVEASRASYSWNKTRAAQNIYLENLTETMKGVLFDE